mgnify:FL=1
MFKKIIIEVILGLLVKLGGYIMASIKKAREIASIKKKQKAKERAIEDANTTEEIHTAHRNNKL